MVMIMYTYMWEPDYGGQEFTGVHRIGPGMLGESCGTGPLIILCLESYDLNTESAYSRPLRGSHVGRPCRLAFTILTEYKSRHCWLHTIRH